MTEAEWLACTEPGKMLAFLDAHGDVTERKLRLFGVACVRRIWHLFSEEAGQRFLEAAKQYAESVTVSGDVFKPCREIVEVLERYGEGQANLDDLESAYDGVSEIIWNANDYIDPCALETIAAEAAAAAASFDLERDPTSPDRRIELFGVPGRAARAAALAATQLGIWPGTPNPVEAAEGAAQAGLLLEIFGNPFSTSAFNFDVPAPTMHSLARAAYEYRELPSGALDPDRLAVLSDALEEAGCTDASILDHLRGPGPHVRGCWVIDTILGKE
jgi:hypothetical protein